MQRDYEAFINDFCLGLEKNEAFIRRGCHLLDDASAVADTEIVRIAWRKDKGFTHVFSVRTEELYRRYQSGRGIRELVEDLFSSFSDMEPDKLDDIVRQIDDYDTIRGRLFIRTINYDRSKEQLEKCVYRKVGDIAQTLYIKAGSHGDILTSWKIPKSLVKNWGRDEAEVFDAALLNTLLQAPPRMYKWERILSDPSYEGENFMDIMKPGVLSKGPAGNCISTTEKTNGAIAAFMPGVLPRIADLLESDLYLAFTSIHEVMVHSADSAAPDQIRNVLTATIDECTSEQDFLSKNIFFYDRHEGHVICLPSD